jgi:integrase
MLTAKRAEREKRPGRYRDDRNLYLVVRNSNNRSWDFRYMVDGRERHMGLGPVHTINLKEARERALAARKLLLDGIDPIDARRSERAAARAAKAKVITFAEAALTYHSQHADGWRNARHRAQFIATLKQHVFPLLGALPVTEIDRPLVIKVLERPVKAERNRPAGPFWQARPATAQRVRSRIHMVLDWAIGRGFRDGPNPAQWGPLKGVLPARAADAKVKHLAALPYAELPAFMLALREQESIAARALEFAILTAARSGEVTGATWREIGDLANKTWTIPAGRTKGAREHRVALSECAVELLRELPTEANNEHIFVGPRAGAGLGPMALRKVLERMGRDDLTVHGFRASFKTWSTERTNFPNELVEMALSHRVGDATERAYRRGDGLAKRYALAEAWARFCTSSPATGATVVPMHAGRS